jgi:hypothetical protein
MGHASMEGKMREAAEKHAQQLQDLQADHARTLQQLEDAVAQRRALEAKRDADQVTHGEEVTRLKSDLECAAEEKGELLRNIKHLETVFKLERDGWENKVFTAEENLFKVQKELDNLKTATEAARVDQGEFVPEDTRLAQNCRAMTPSKNWDNFGVNFPPQQLRKKPAGVLRFLGSIGGLFLSSHSPTLALPTSGRKKRSQKRAIETLTKKLFLPKSIEEVHRGSPSRKAMM